MSVTLLPNISGTLGLWQLQGNLNDSSGNGLTLTQQFGTAAYGSIDGTNQYYNFDGTRGLSINDSSLRLGTEITCQMIIKLNNTNVATYFMCYPGTSTTQELYHWYTSGSGYVGYGDQNFPASGSGGLGPPYYDVRGMENTFHLLTLRKKYNGSTYTVSTFVDGVQVGTDKTSAACTPSGTEKLWIGAYHGGPELYADVASIRILNYGRTDADIAADAALAVGSQATSIYTSSGSLYSTNQAAAGEALISVEGGLNSISTQLNLHGVVSGHTVGLWQLQSDLLDSSGNGRDLSMSTGSATYTVLSGSLNGFDFNAARRLIAPNDSAFRFTGEFTLQFFAITRDSGTQTFFQCEGTALPYAWYVNNSGMSYADQHVNANFSPAIDLGTSSVRVNHFTFRRRSTGGGNYIAEVFENGIKRAGTLTTTTATPSGDERLYIGGFPSGVNLNAIVASIRVLDYARSDADIQTDANGTLGLQPLARLHTNISGTVGLWQFQGNKDDASGNGNALSVDIGGEGYAELAGSMQGFDFTGTTRLKSAAVSQIQQAGDMTIEFLMRFVGGGTQTFIQTETSGGSNLYAWYYDGSQLAYVDQHINSALSPSISLSSYLSPDVHHFAFRRTLQSGTTYKMEAFLDGVKQSGTATNTLGNTAAGTEVMYLGGFLSGVNLKGVMTSLRLLNYSRADADILQDYQDTLGNSAGFTFSATATGSVKYIGDAVAGISITASGASALANADGSGSTQITFNESGLAQALSFVSANELVQFLATGTMDELFNTNIVPFSFDASATATGSGAATGNGFLLFSQTGADLASGDGALETNTLIEFDASLFYVTPLNGSVSFGFDETATLSGEISAIADTTTTEADFETSLRVSQQFGTSFDNMINLAVVKARPSFYIVNRTSVTGYQLITPSKRSVQLISSNKRTVSIP